MKSYQDAVNLAQEVAHESGLTLFDVFPSVIRIIIQERLWAERIDDNGKPFKSFQAFAEHRIWQGLELSIPRVILYCQDQPDVVRLIQDEVGEGEFRQREVAVKTTPEAFQEAIQNHLPGYKLVEIDTAENPSVSAAPSSGE